MPVPIDGGGGVPPVIVGSAMIIYTTNIRLISNTTASTRTHTTSTSLKETGTAKTTLLSLLLKKLNNLNTNTTNSSLKKSNLNNNHSTNISIVANANGSSKTTTTSALLSNKNNQRMHTSSIVLSSVKSKTTTINSLLKQSNLNRTHSTSISIFKELSFSSTGIGDVDIPGLIGCSYSTLLSIERVSIKFDFKIKSFNRSLLILNGWGVNVEEKIYSKSDIVNSNAVVQNVAIQDDVVGPMKVAINCQIEPQPTIENSRSNCKFMNVIFKKKRKNG